jgi:hypothetical protein
MISHHPRQITLLEFSVTFVPFGLLLFGALVWAEMSTDLTLERIKASIWATSILLTVALTIAPFRSMSRTLNNLAGLYWSFTLLIFLVHAYWAIFRYFGGIAETFEGMGISIAGLNFLLTIWWTLDVLLMWLLHNEPRWLRIAHVAARVFTFLVFAITLLFLRADPARYLGVVFTASVIVALIVRWLAGTRRETAATASS